MSKRIISFLLALALSISMMPTTVFADSTVSDVGAGAGKTTTKTNAIYTWGNSQEGLRFSIVNKDGETVTTKNDTIDVVASTPPSNIRQYLANKFTGIYETVTNKMYTIDQMTEMVAKQLQATNPDLLLKITNTTDLNTAIQKFVSDYKIPGSR